MVCSFFFAPIAVVSTRSAANSKRKYLKKFLFISVAVFKLVIIFTAKLVSLRLTKVYNTAKIRGNFSARRGQKRFRSGKKDVPKQWGHTPVAYRA